MINPFEIFDNRLENIENILFQLKQLVPSVPPDVAIWMDIDGLCSYHPNNPSKKTVYAWTYKGKIPHYKDPGGKGVRFLKSEIDEWLKTGRVSTKHETSDNPTQFLKKRKK
jgi:excisionase family DNA binding protein